MVSELNDDDIARLRIALGRISRQLDRRTASDDLTRTQMTVLATVSRRGPIGASELADLEGINPTMLSRVVARLEELGYVKRSVSADDRRVVRIVITAAGSRKHARWRAERGQVLADHVARIPAPDVQRLIDALPALESLGEAMFSSPVRA